MILQKTSIDTVGKGAPVRPLAPTWISLLYSTIKYDLSPFHTARKERGLVHFEN